MNQKDTSVIPKGCYCYSPAEGVSKYGIPNIKNCPYMSSKEYNGVLVPYCEYLEEGDEGNITEEDHKKLLEHFGSEEKLKEILPLDLLWDSCKCCGENEDFEELYGNTDQKEG